MHIKQVCIFFTIILGLTAQAADLQSSTTSIQAGTANGRLGTLTIIVDKDEFPTLPVFLEFCLPDGVVLANTLSTPITLGPKLGNSTLAIELADLPKAQIVDHQQGQRCFSVEIVTVTNTWLRTSGAGTLLPPYPDVPVEFTIGISAAASTAFNAPGDGNSGDTEMTVDLSGSTICCGAEIGLTMTARDGVDGNLLPISTSTVPVLATVSENE